MSNKEKRLRNKRYKRKRIKANPNVRIIVYRHSFEENIYPGRVVAAADYRKVM